MAGNTIAIGIFLSFVLATLGITAWARLRIRTTAQFYVADGTVRPWQNGMAIAGDYLSAASFLGTIAVFFSSGVDGMIYAVGAAAGWPVMTCLFAERIRSLGRYTFSDVLSRNLAPRPVRAMTSLITICICASYLTAQMVGAGTLVELLFGIPYIAAVSAVGILMMSYVMLGGMLATTIIQVVKASMLIATALLMSFLLIEKFDFSLLALTEAAAASRPDPNSFLRPTGLLSGWFDALGLAFAFALGPAGMPHILMRFFTVPDPRAARVSLVYASSLVIVFQLLVILLGCGAIALVSGSSGSSGGHALPGGENMAAIHLARALGNSVLLGIVAAVTFATILVVVSGLTLAAVSAISHDLYRYVLRDNGCSDAQEVRISKLATAAVASAAIGAGILFRHENIGFLATLPLVVAASTNFPLLLSSLYSQWLTTAGAVAGGLSGLVTSVALIILGPRVWISTLGHQHAVLESDYPTLISMGVAFWVAYGVSRVTRTTELAPARGHNITPSRPESADVVPSRRRH